MVRRNAKRELNPEDFIEENEEPVGQPNLLGIITRVEDEEEGDGLVKSSPMGGAPADADADTPEDQWDDTSGDSEPEKASEEGPADADIENEEA